MFKKPKKPFCKWRDFERDVEQIGELKKLEKECAALKTIAEKLHYGEELINSYKQFFDFTTKIKENWEEKNDQRSTSLLNKGIDFLKQEMYKEATVAFNLSLGFAASRENLALGFAHRSKIHFELGRYEDCRKDIYLAKQNDDALPEIWKNQLNVQENECAGKMNPKFINARNVGSQLSCDKNRELPFFVEHIGIKKIGSESLLYAKEHIEPEAVIMKMENRFVLTVEAWCSSCHFCLKTLTNLIPCPNCVYALFCSEDCMKNANEHFHNWECRIMNLLFFFQDNLVLIAFRTFLKMLNIFKDYRGLEAYWKETAQNHVTWYSFAPEKYNETAHLHVLHSLGKKCNSDPHTILMLTITAATFKREIMNHCKDLRGIFQTDQQQDLFGEIILQHLLTFYCICSTELGRGLNQKFPYVIYDLVVHEFNKDKSYKDYNIQRNIHGNCFTLIADRAIKKGEILKAAELNDIEKELQDLGKGWEEDDEEEDDNEEMSNLRNFVKKLLQINSMNVLWQKFDNARATCVRSNSYFHL